MRIRYDRGMRSRKLTEPDLTANARTVLEHRYLRRDEMGAVCETPGQLFWRVAEAIAEVEPRNRKRWAERFYELMRSLRFIPNSPTLMNAGKPKGQLSACFVLPVGDSLEQIFETLKHAAKIHQSGGGTGFAFSRLRPRGSLVRSTHGVASGPVSFMRIFDTATETIKQGGTRRGANMAILRVDHPDIEEFIDCKRDFKSVTNFNISVGITDEFMEAVRSDRVFELRDPGDGNPVRSVRSTDLFDRMVQAAWECGDPGLVFLDRINQFNPTPQVGPMESTNPCGEQPLLPYESCNLGSLNLGLYFTGHGVDWDLLKADIHYAVRFLDNVIDANDFPVAECGKITRRNRKIGLGVMGLADLLLLLGIPYDSEEAIALGERMMAFVDREAKMASALLAKEKGAFPNWKGSSWERLGFPRLRNATVSTVAPTGTISMIAGASSGIEPIFAARFVRNVLSGEQLTEVHPAVQRLLEKRDVSDLEESEIEKAIGPAWKPAPKVNVDSHVRMQAAFQRFSDSAVSKTINLPFSATPEEVRQAYCRAYDLGCKGITVYRDQSRPSQVLESRDSGPHCESC